MPDPVAALIAQLSARDSVARTQAAERLAHLPDTRAVRPLLQCLRDPSDTVQVAAATALGAIQDVRAVAPLIRMFHGATYGLLDRDGSPGLYFRILASAACALAHIGATPGVEALFAQLHSDAAKDWLKTEAAVLALGAVRDPRTLPTLLTALHSPSWLVRAQAATALGQLGDPGAVRRYSKRYTIPRRWSKVRRRRHWGHFAMRVPSPPSKPSSSRRQPRCPPHKKKPESACRQKRPVG